MQRYFALPFIIILSIVLLCQATIEAQGALPPLPQEHSKQGDSATVKKTKVVTKTRTVTKTTQQKPVATQTTKPAPKKKNNKQQVADNTAPGKSQSTGPVKTEGVVVGTKRSTSPPAVATKQPCTVPQPVVSRKKVLTNKTTVSVSTSKAASPPDIERLISSRSFMVMDAGTGATLFAKAPDAQRQPASTIKIVTAMIALKSLKSDEVINVSRRAAEMPSSKIFLDPKQDYRANDLINAVLLASANDASVALAEKIAGSEDKFANLMTISAKMWGAQNTLCRTASGLTAVGQYSTARDLANLFRYAMQHAEFARRVHEKTIRTSYGKTLLNHNKALWRVEGAVGGKTGYTAVARQTYVGQFTRDDKTIVVAIMGSETMWADLKNLVEHGFSKKKQEQLAQTGPESTTPNMTRIN